MPVVPESHDPALREARRLVLGAGRVLVLTGAGVSAESGVPTFRGAGGLWREYRAEQLATPEAFARDPRLVWEWYGWRREVVRGCAPNAAHLALAALAAGREGVTIITQNVDGLHTRAAHAVGEGAERALPIELHGSLFRTRCTVCGRQGEDAAPVDARDRESLPACERCCALLRPDVVWFGESLDPALVGAAFAEAERSDVCLVVGTSAVVHPAAGIAITAHARGAQLIEVNPEPTPLTPLAAVSLRVGAAATVPTIVGESP